MKDQSVGPGRHELSHRGEAGISAEQIAMIIPKSTGAPSSAITNDTRNPLPRIPGHLTFSGVSFSKVISFACNLGYIAATKGCAVLVCKRDAIGPLFPYLFLRITFAIGRDWDLSHPFNVLRCPRLGTGSPLS